VRTRVRVDGHGFIRVNEKVRRRRRGRVVDMILKSPGDIGSGFLQRLFRADLFWTKKDFDLQKTIDSP
jgi:hypothetical protein